MNRNRIFGFEVLHQAKTILQKPLTCCIKLSALRLKKSKVSLNPETIDLLSRGLRLFQFLALLVAFLPNLSTCRFHFTDATDLCH